MVSLLVGDVPEVFQCSHLIASQFQHELVLLLGLVEPSLCPEETGNHGRGFPGQTGLAQFVKDQSGLREIEQGRVPVGLPRIIQKERGVQAGKSELLRGGVIQQGVAIVGLCSLEVAVPIVGVAQSIVRFNLHVHIVHLFGDGQGFVQVIQGLADRFLELVGTEFALERSPLEQQLPPVPIDVLEFCFKELGQKINAFQILAARKSSPS